MASMGNAARMRAEPACVTTQSVLGWTVLILAVAGVALIKLSQRRQDEADGVVARFRDLRLSRSAVIVGRATGAPHYELRPGMTALAEDAEGLVYLSITWPGGYLIRQVPKKNGSTVGTQARAFAAAMNMYVQGLPL